MSNTKQRQRLLKQILMEEEVGNQDSLAKQLQDLGVVATQATVSRDLKALGAVKLRNLAGDMVYSLPADSAEANPGRLREVLADFVLSLEAAGQLVVLKTHPGAAQFVASELDRSGPEEIVGTIAGDDTLSAITHNTKTAKRVALILTRIGDFLP